ncbi:MAG: hypothetical protein KGS72_07730 [Cyanobacteria bacterium REEB67]|nr:hypothetical protein [Cyanobacteria bacterium REEB67]
MSPYFNNQPDKKSRIIGALCYMSSGIIGLIYLLVDGKGSDNQFFRYHFYQAMLLGIFAVLISWTEQGLGMFIGGLFGLTGSAGAGVGSSVLMGIDLLGKLAAVVILVADVYGLIQCLRGKYADMPMISRLVRGNLR